MDVAPGRMRQPDRRDSKVDLGIHHTKSRGCKIRLRIRELDIGSAAVLKQFSSHAICFLGRKQAAPTPLSGCASVLQRLPVLRDLGANRVLGAPASSLSFPSLNRSMLCRLIASSTRFMSPPLRVNSEARSSMSSAGGGTPT